MWSVLLVVQFDFWCLQEHLPTSSLNLSEGKRSDCQNCKDVQREQTAGMGPKTCEASNGFTCSAGIKYLFF